jgi:hypothetical protein
MTRHFIPGKDEHYKFIRSEYAQFLGISTNALRMRMRHGKYGSEYVIKDGKYLFRRPRDNMVELTPGPRATDPDPGPKKKYNRGATHRGDAKYGNDSFRRHNEVRALNKIQRNLGDEYTSEINEEVIKIAQERVIAKKDKIIKDAIKAPTKTLESVPYGIDTTDGKYGSMLNAEGLKSVEDRHHEFLGRKWLYTSVNGSSPGNSTFFGNFNGYTDNNNEKGSVEIEDRDIPADDREPRFSSKVEESIWRLKNKK